MGHFVRRPGRRLLKKQATRRHLMRAGRKLFGRSGLYESHIEDLTTRAGIAKGTLYLYFRNKEQLVLEVTLAGYEDLRHRVEQSLGGERTTRGLMRALMRAHLEFFSENPDLIRIFHQVRGLLKFRRPEWRRLRAPLEAHIRYLESVLARATPATRRNPRERRRLAIQLYGAVSGIVSVHSVLEPRADLRRALSRWPLDL